MNNEKKTANIKNQQALAQRKIQAINANTAALMAKRKLIDEQIQKNQKKVEQINFFLRKLQSAQPENTAKT